MAKHQLSEDDVVKLMKPVTPEIYRSDPIEATASPDPLGKTQITVTLDQLRPYDRNPRKTRNPKYDEIKESIRNTGLKQKFKLTRRHPDDDDFMISDGGGTRLEILWELWTETGDERYYRFEKVDFEPWKSEIAALAGHMSENENRGSTLLIEKALAAAEFRKLFEGAHSIFSG